MYTKKHRIFWGVSLLISFFYLCTFSSCGGVSDSSQRPTLPPPPEPYYENPYQNFQYWYKGNTHAHTVASDGELRWDEVLTLYALFGYDFLVITDHNTTWFRGGGGGGGADDVPLKPLFQTESGDILLINRSCESGYNWENHLTAIDVDTCPEECCSNDAAILIEPFPPQNKCDGVENQKRINQALDQGGIVILNHPGSVNDFGVEQGWPKEKALQMQGFHGIEIAITEKDIDTWIYLLNKGRIVWGVGSDDYHSGEPGKHGWIVVNSNSIINSQQNSDASQQDIINNIRDGNFYSVVRAENGRTDGPKFTKIITLGNTVSIEYTDASMVRFSDCQGLLKADSVSNEGETHSSSYIPDEESGLRLLQGYMLIELEDRTGNIAYSQPLHVIGAGTCPDVPAPPPPTPPCSDSIEPCCEGYHSCGGQCYLNDMECP
jgi:hypothetical protein